MIELETEARDYMAAAIQAVGVTQETFNETFEETRDDLETAAYQYGMVLRLDPKNVELLHASLQAVIDAANTHQGGYLVAHVGGFVLPE